jgi:hypothetical protein
MVLIALARSGIQPATMHLESPAFAAVANYRDGQFFFAVTAFCAVIKLVFLEILPNYFRLRVLMGG